jgi:hypothetical protein
MQLDGNRIVIRERSFIDVMDLALRVVRAHAWPLTVAFSAGVVPMVCLNAWLLSDYARNPAEFEWSDDRLIYVPTWFLWYSLLLMVWEIPLATAPITLYLGQALFHDRPRAREIVGASFRSLPQMVWYQVVLRALLVPWVVTWPLLFGAWPYLSEVILLERNPWWSRQRMTTFRRTRALHGRSGGELFARWIGATAAGVLLFVAAWISVFAVGGLLLSEWEFAGPVYTVLAPLAAWSVVGFFAVVRFLAYLDLRIRCEGWEVELMVRAEGVRLTRRLA